MGRGTVDRAGRGAVAVLASSLALSGCGLIVTQRQYEKDKQQTDAQIQVIRKQLLAHTQILANHGKSINEVRLQLRDAVSVMEKRVDKALSVAEGERGKKQAGPAGKEPAKKESAKEARQRPEAPAGRAGSRLMYVRAVYRGLPLNYAAGYSAPRGKRLPFRLSPGTEVRTVTGDARGFTRVEVASGRWRGKSMWVRTRWLIPVPPAGRAN